MKARALPVLALAVLAAAARADLNFSNIEATVTFDGTETFDLDVLEGPNGIDFFAGDRPLYVDNVNSEFSSAVIEISYDATIDDNDLITGLELLFSGWAFGNGVITYDETVFDSEGGTELASVFGVRNGDDPFVQVDLLEFEGQRTFHVEKRFTLNIEGEGNPISLASIGLIEQNAVPEPATMGALAIGALGLLARRRRR